MGVVIPFKRRDELDAEAEERQRRAHNVAASNAMIKHIDEVREKVVKGEMEAIIFIAKERGRPGYYKTLRMYDFARSKLVDMCESVARLLLE